MFIGSIGDVNWSTHGGILVFKNDDNTYRAIKVDCWRLEVGDDLGDETPEDEYDPRMRWDLYEFDLDQLQIKDDLLVNEYGNKEFYSDKLESISECIGVLIEELTASFASPDPMVRVWAYDAVGSYYGFIELDSNPLTVDRKKIDEFEKKIESIKK